MHRAMSSRATGTVLWFDAARGYGFIERDGGERDCFVERAVTDPDDRRYLMKGTRVTFDVVEGVGGASAVNVARL
jgi:CspA family cold shock protein